MRYHPKETSQWYISSSRALPPGFFFIPTYITNRWYIFQENTLLLRASPWWFSGNNIDTLSMHHWSLKHPFTDQIDNHTNHQRLSKQILHFAATMIVSIWILCKHAQNDFIYKLMFLSLVHRLSLCHYLNFILSSPSLWRWVLPGFQKQAKKLLESVHGHFPPHPPGSLNVVIWGGSLQYPEA